MKTALTICLLIGAAFAQTQPSTGIQGVHDGYSTKEFFVSSELNKCVLQGVVVKVSYTLPEDDFTRAAKTDPQMAPTTMYWYWGDKSHDEGPFAKMQTASHTYAKPGTYGILIVVNDAKGRNIRQSGVTIRVQEPFVVVPAGQ